jgi:hypothetical protein
MAPTVFAAYAPPTALVSNDPPTLHLIKSITIGKLNPKSTPAGSTIKVAATN